MFIVRKGSLVFIFMKSVGNKKFFKLTIKFEFCWPGFAANTIEIVPNNSALNHSKVPSTIQCYIRPVI